MKESNTQSQPQPIVGKQSVMRERQQFVKEVIAGKYQQEGWFGFSCKKENRPRTSI